MKYTIVRNRAPTGDRPDELQKDSLMYFRFIQNAFSKLEVFISCFGETLLELTQCSVQSRLVSAVFNLNLDPFSQIYHGPRLPAGRNSRCL